MSKVKVLSGNALKIIGAVLMLIDHVGLIIFPQIKILRIVGRLSFPMFAFMIAEGCKYTKNKLRYFLGVFALGVVCQVVYYLFTKDSYFNVLITFSISILLVYALQNVKKRFKEGEKKISIVIFVLAIAGIYLLNKVFVIDYGFWGCLLPLFASIFHRDKNLTATIEILAFGVGLLIFALAGGLHREYSLLSLLLLLLYSGKRGKLNLKHFFYIFYPLHLVAIYCINLVL